MIGKIQRIPLREVWRHEALDFTKWLQDNLDVLNEVIGLSLSSAEREHPAGDFSVDLIAEDAGGNPVIIENQLERSNHDHLGKLLTYLVAIGAKAAIWIVADPRPEHVNAITWLNESSAAAFYLLKLEGIKIEKSLPAPLLTLIVGPSEESKELGETKKDLAERYTIRERFWSQLLEKAKGKTKLHATISPGQLGWIGTGAGRTGLAFNYVVRQHDANVELYIDCGAEEENKEIVDFLFSSKANIESVFGGSLEWQRLDDKRACRVKKDIDSGGYREDPSKWSEIQDAMIEAMIRLEKAFKPHISKLEV